MIFFIIGVVAALFALAVLLLAKEYKNSAIIPAVVAVVMIGISCVSYVPTGYTGIVMWSRWRKSATLPRNGRNSTGITSRIFTSVCDSATVCGRDCVRSGRRMCRQLLSSSH